MKPSVSINWPAVQDQSNTQVWAKAYAGSGLWSWWYARRLARQTKQLGRGLSIVGRPVVINAGHLVIGNDVQLISDYQPTRLAVGPQAELKIGDGTVINSSIIAAQQQVLIGKHCRLAPFVHEMDE
ncbi:MAG: hypothetical protein AAFN81_07765, partial [Bacteroidota bacterium]